jgi:hypothetical protein
VVAGARDERRERRPVERLDLGVAIVPGELLGLGPIGGDVSRLVGGVDDPRPQVAVDPVAGDEAAHQRLRLLGHVPERPRPRPPERGLEPVLVAPLARADLAAVPPRGPPADPLGLEEDDRQPRLGEMERRREPGVAAADDADVGHRIAGERRKERQRLRGRGVPARGIFPRPVVRRQQILGRHAPP